MNQAFTNDNFYGLEYFLTSWLMKKSLPVNPKTIDWFGAADYFA
jgi:hypothetical protein